MIRGYLFLILALLVGCSATPEVAVPQVAAPGAAKPQPTKPRRARTKGGDGGIQDAIRQRFGGEIHARGAADGQTIVWVAATGRWVPGEAGAEPGSEVIAFSTGLGAVDQITGPSDQTFSIRAGGNNTATGRPLFLQAASGTATGGDAYLFGGDGGTTAGWAGIAAGFGDAVDAEGGSVEANAGSGTPGGDVLVRLGEDLSGGGAHGEFSITGGSAAVLLALTETDLTLGVAQVFGPTGNPLEISAGAEEGLSLKGLSVDVQATDQALEDEDAGSASVRGGHAVLSTGAAGYFGGASGDGTPGSLEFYAGATPDKTTTGRIVLGAVNLAGEPDVWATVDRDGLKLTEAAAPSTPDAGQVTLYAKTDGLVYSKDSAGGESLVSSTGWISGGTFGGTWVDNTTYTGLYRWVGPNLMECQVVVATSGAPTAVILALDPPAGWDLDTSGHVFVGGTEPQSVEIGVASANDAGNGRYGPGICYLLNSSATQVSIQLPWTGGENFMNLAVQSATPFVFGANDCVFARFTISVTPE